MAEEAWAREVQTPEAQPSIDEQQQQQEAAFRERQMQQRRLLELQSLPQLDQSQLKELKALQDHENAMNAIDAQRMNEQVQFMQLLLRADSKHADRLYSRFGAPPPIKPLDAVVSEEDPEGFVRKMSTYETKDFTYWDKLRRHNTQTIIRRWHTYVPAGEEDTAFFERNIRKLPFPVTRHSPLFLCCPCHFHRRAPATSQTAAGPTLSAGCLASAEEGGRLSELQTCRLGMFLRQLNMVLFLLRYAVSRAEANVPGEAYSQGIYYKQLDVGIMSAREYKLPTESYVAPPVYIRRTGNPEKRIHDPIRQMARNIYSCSTCSSC